MCTKTEQPHTLTLSSYTLELFSSIFKKPFLAGCEYSVIESTHFFLHVTSNIDDYFYIAIAFMFHSDFISMISIDSDGMNKTDF